jgi:hypothetical protein
MMRDSPHVVAFDRLTMWKRSEKEQPICNDSVSMAERLRDYLTRVEGSAHEARVALNQASIRRLSLSLGLPLRKELGAG